MAMSRTPRLASHRASSLSYPPSRCVSATGHGCCPAVKHASASSPGRLLVAQPALSSSEIVLRRASRWCISSRNQAHPKAPRLTAAATRKSTCSAWTIRLW